MLQGDYKNDDGDLVTYAWRACMNDFQLNTAIENLKTNGYVSIDSRAFKIQDPTLKNKPYSCVTQFKFYVKKTG